MLTLTSKVMRTFAEPKIPKPESRHSSSASAVAPGGSVFASSEFEVQGLGFVFLSRGLKAWGSRLPGMWDVHQGAGL